MVESLINLSSANMKLQYRSYSAVISTLFDEEKTVIDCIEVTYPFSISGKQNVLSQILLVNAQPSAGRATSIPLDIIEVKHINVVVFAFFPMESQRRLDFSLAIASSLR